MKITWKQKINPVFWLGNIDEPNPPADKWVNKPQWIRRILWFIRNPFHNFTFYVIGMADRLEYREPDHVFNPFHRWNIILPFISYHNGKYKWYLGWRERGNWGFKRPMKDKS
jgi:hypothetical protein